MAVRPDLLFSLEQSPVLDLHLSNDAQATASSGSSTDMEQLNDMLLTVLKWGVGKSVSSNKIFGG
jgi:hypothetical protein